MVCVCVYIHKPMCSYLHSFSHGVCSNMYMPCMFYASTYHSGRMSQMYSICGMSFSISFPIRGVMGIQLQDPTYVLCSFLICSCLKSFWVAEFILFFSFLFLFPWYLQEETVSTECVPVAESEWKLSWAVFSGVVFNMWLQSFRGVFLLCMCSWSFYA